MYGLYHNVSFNLQTTSTLSAASEQQSFLCKVYNWSNLKMPRLQVIIKVDNRVTPPAPYSITVAGMERHQWRDKNGELQTSSKEGASHYHAKLSCIRAVEPSSFCWAKPPGSI